MTSAPYGAASNHLRLKAGRDNLMTRKPIKSVSAVLVSVIQYAKRDCTGAMPSASRIRQSAVCGCVVGRPASHCTGECNPNA
ncbi:hypothetical protein D3C87_1978430 [compost metagenome]